MGDEQRGPQGGGGGAFGCSSHVGWLFCLSLGKWSDEGPGDHLMGRELVPQLWPKAGGEIGYRMIHHLDC